MTGLDQRNRHDSDRISGLRRRRVAPADRAAETMVLSGRAPHGRAGRG